MHAYVEQHKTGIVGSINAETEHEWTGFASDYPKRQLGGTARSDFHGPAVFLTGTPYDPSTRFAFNADNTLRFAGGITNTETNRHLATERDRPQVDVGHL